MKDLTYLKWSYSSSSSGGTYLKSEDGIGSRKIYYKLSDFKYGKFSGCEAAIEVIASRLGEYLGFPVLKYIHTRFLIRTRSVLYMAIMLLYLTVTGIASQCLTRRASGTASRCQIRLNRSSFPTAVLLQSSAETVMLSAKFPFTIKPAMNWLYGHLTTQDSLYAVHLIPTLHYLQYPL